MRRAIPFAVVLLLALGCDESRPTEPEASQVVELADDATIAMKVSGPKPKLPSDCSVGDVVKWAGTSFVCTAQTAGDGNTLWARITFSGGSSAADVDVISSQGLVSVQDGVGEPPSLVFAQDVSICALTVTPIGYSGAVVEPGDLSGNSILIRASDASYVFHCP
ncbi:hypothetical protein ACFL5T_02735 [Gemmatimonadota bacterium]